jgi:hypothetical protein
MKKVITFIMIFTMLCAVCTVVVSAEDGGAATTLESALDRLLEWWEVNKAEILAACSGLGAAFASFVLWLKSKPQFNILQKSAKITDERENALIKGYNEVVEVIGQYNENVKALTAQVQKLQTLVVDTEDIERHIATMLSTAYTNSVLPQGVKDIISLECAETMKIANKDLGVEVISYDTTDEGESA